MKAGIFQLTKKHNGAVLVLCLIMLVGLSLLGLAATSEHQWQQRVVSNIESTASAHYIMKAALIWSEDWLMSRDSLSQPEPCSSPCPESTAIHASGVIPADVSAQPSDWWQTHATAAGFDPHTGILSDFGGIDGQHQAWWLIEELNVQEPDPETPAEVILGWYRVIAFGQTNPFEPPVIAESILVRPWATEEAETHPDSTSVCANAMPDGRCGRVAWQHVR